MGISEQRPSVRYRTVASTRLSTIVLERVRRLAAAREERLSEFVRAAIRERVERLEREATR